MKKHYLFNTVTIIGVGLLGGSLAKAIRRRRLAKKIYGVCRTSTSARQARLGTGCEAVVGCDPAILRSSDCVILATRVDAIINNFSTIAPYLKPGTIVMDVGSTKVRIEQAARKLPRNVHFVGCHPMAGSEKRGPKYADANLFEGALCFILKNAHRPSRKTCEKLWKALGSHVTFTTAQVHDRIAAKVSHLPHAASTALLSAMMRHDPHHDLRFGGTGLASMIRIAGANPEMWADIFASNRQAVRRELKALIQELKRFDRALARKDTGQLLKLLQISQKLKQVA